MLIARSASLQQYIPGGASSKSISLDLTSIWKAGEDSLSIIMYAGLSPLVSRCSCRPLKARPNLWYVIAFMERIMIRLLLYSYNMNRYLLPLFEVTGNFPVRSVSICLLWLMILVSTVLVRCASGVIGGSYFIMGTCGLVDTRFFFVWCM